MDRRTWKVAEDIQRERLAWLEQEQLAKLALGVGAKHPAPSYRSWLPVLLIAVLMVGGLAATFMLRAGALELIPK